MWQRRYGFPDRRCAMRSATASIRPTRWRASSSSSSCCPKAGAPAQSFRSPIPRCNRCSASPSTSRRRCPPRSRPRSSCSSQHRVGELQNHLSKLLVGQGLRKFLEHTLIPLNEAVHERVVRGDMQNFQELRFADLAQRLLRDVTRLVRPTRDARQILLATPPNDPNQLGLAILELLLFTEGVNCLTLGAGVPAQEIAGAASAYKVALVVLLFDRGISGKIAGQEIRGLRAALPPETAAGGQRPCGEPAREADSRRADRRGLQLGDGRRCARSACCRPRPCRWSACCRTCRSARRSSYEIVRRGRSNAPVRRRLPPGAHGHRRAGSLSFASACLAAWHVAALLSLAHPARLSSAEFMLDLLNMSWCWRRVWASRMRLRRTFGDAASPMRIVRSRDGVRAACRRRCFASAAALKSRRCRRPAMREAGLRR